MHSSCDVFKKKEKHNLTNFLVVNGSWECVILRLTYVECPVHFTFKLYAYIFVQIARKFVAVQNEVVAIASNYIKLILLNAYIDTTIHKGGCVAEKCSSGVECILTISFVCFIFSVTQRAPGQLRLLRRFKAIFGTTSPYPGRPLYRACRPEVVKRK